MQNELQEARGEASATSARCRSLEAEIRQLMEQEEKSRRLQAEAERLQRHLTSLQREVTKLKDEKCDLYIRYTTVVEEKSATSGRLHDLNLQVYQLQTELQSLQMEKEFQKQHSLRCHSAPETPQLQEEVRKLRSQLEKAERLDPARQDILAQDLAEAIDSQVELAEELRCYREENEKLLRDKQGLSDQKEKLSLQVQQLSLDCKMHQQKTTVAQNQMRELQAERDQAYLSRDEAQAMIARILAEKDALRSQLVELQETVFQSERGSDKKKISWQNPSPNSEEDPPPARRRLRRMDALNPASMSESEDPAVSSVRSRSAQPPSPESLRRREVILNADSSLETAETDCLLDDFVFLPDEGPSLASGREDKKTPRLSSSSGSTSISSSRTSAPPFLVRSRPRAIRVNGRVLSLSFQGEALLSQLTVVGGNKTGVFVHQVTAGSSAHTVGINPGAQLVEVKYEQKDRAVRMVLEDSTLEEATWALSQVTGFCHLSLRPRQDDYEALLQQLQANDASSGDSFYIRVNVSLAAGSGGALSVSCNDVLHVTNTRPAGAEDQWHASQVHPCQLLDLQRGSVPNYYRAQRLLIRAIEEINFQTQKCLKDGQTLPESKEKAVRIVSTGRPGRNPLWVSVEKEKMTSSESGAPPLSKSCVTLMPYTLVSPHFPPRRNPLWVSVEKEKMTSSESGSPPPSKSCVTLMPYTLVSPHFPPVCRPVLLLPTVLGRILDKKLASWQGFELCEPEVLSSCEHSARLQRSEILEDCEQGENCCYTRQSVEKVMKKGIHCVLPLGLDCVRRLHRFDIFPIIVFVGQSARNARKLRSKLQRDSSSEEQLLACSRREEPLLDKLPCLYRSMAPDSWCDQTSLLTSLRTVIWEEQRKIVWLEQDPW
ncbi:caspase recruitment domain-containing protein 14 [Austrofundulus limnaeus]|uniref:Caspase recruitment domain-containing protein 14 n=1 Tax=Austrofundulus limnaeus TaxID=52670 RepID=A0A2I4AKJ7_AUSLI|nr:PREDICTED: caspase recruitment domain-containing protein 14-like [Austrofundulus limnaeus]